MFATVFRIAPITTKDIPLAVGHITRELRETDIHIDTDRTRQNRFIVGRNSINEIGADTMREMGKYQSNDSRTADYLAEGFMSANREYFDSEFKGWENDPDLLKPWIDASVEFLKSGKVGQVVSAVLHLDETTPHLHFVSVPVTQVTRGNRYGSKTVERLAYNAIFSDSKQHIAECKKNGTTSTDTKLGRLQTEYANAVSHLHLKRGVMSDARHVSPAEYRRKIKKKPKRVQSNFSPDETSLLTYKSAHINNINKAKSIIKQLTDLANEYVDIANAKDIENGLLKDKSRAQESTIMRLSNRIQEQAAVIRENKPYIDAIRRLDSKAIIEKFGYKESAYSDYNFTKRFNALDFVKEVENCDFNTALVLLSEHFTEEDLSSIVRDSDIIVNKVKNEIIEPIKNKDDNAELETFKRDISLVDFATSRGFYTKNKSAASATMVDGGNKIVVSRRDGKDLFFDVHDEAKSGTIIDFCKHYLSIVSLGEIRKTLRVFIGSSTVDIKNAKRMPNKASTVLKETTAESADKTTDFYKLKPSTDSIYLSKRGVDIRSDDIRIDARNNTCFPHYNADGSVIGWEARNNEFKGFVGHKGIGKLAAGSGDGVVIAESMIDSLSYAELYPERVGICISTGGAASDDQLAMIAQYVGEGVAVYVATDNDDAGHALAARIQTLIPTAERDVPSRKDWNDVIKSKRGPRSR